MKICQRSKLPAVPFAVDGSYLVTPRDRLRAYPGTVRLSFGEPIPADEVTVMSASELHDRVRTSVAQILGQAEKPASVAAPLSGPEGIRDDQHCDLTAAAHP